MNVGHSLMETLGIRVPKGIQTMLARINSSCESFSQWKLFVKLCEDRTLVLREQRREEKHNSN